MSISLPDALSIVFVASIVVEIVPIKINPWKFILGIIGKALNQDLTTEVKAIRKEFDAHKAIVEKRYADSCRTRIIRSADEARHDIKHSKEYWDQVLSDIDEYERYCRAHPDYKNHKAVNAIEKIMDLYRSEDWI
mgnify:CR=1 FL=1